VFVNSPPDHKLQKFNRFLIVSCSQAIEGLLDCFVELALRIVELVQQILRVSVGACSQGFDRIFDSWWLWIVFAHRLRFIEAEMSTQSLEFILEIFLLL
jgi:hypothetical protein